MELGIQAAWQAGWQQKVFKRKLLAGAVFMALIISFLPVFFTHIEHREGIELNDVVLRLLQPYDVSRAIFTLNWVMSLFMFFRCIQQPNLFVLFLWSFVMLVLLRITSISFVHLNPPANIIALRDPLSNCFYGSTKFVSKDLFFSGHTATPFAMFLCFTKKRDKMIALAATFVAGLLVLIQHVHYTVDVLAAPFFAYAAVWLGRKVVGNAGNSTE
jgi:hypothetical protein